MKKLNFLSVILISMLYNSQVGINTTNPVATLDVEVKDANDALSLDGLIAPRLAGGQLSAKTYNGLQTGAIVYVTDSSATLAGQTVNVANAGYYYFDGTVWRRMLTSISNNAWLLADIEFSSSINSLQVLTLPPQPGNGTYELINNTTLTVTVPSNYSQNRVTLRWDVWGAPNFAASPGPSQGSLRYAVSYQQGSSTAGVIPSIMMSGWSSVSDVNEPPRFNAPVVFSLSGLTAGTYTFNLMVHRESEINANGIQIWGAQGRGKFMSSKTVLT